MRKLVSWITNKLKDLIGEEHWGDPVWSQVISVGIVAVIGVILSGFSLLLIYLYSLIIKVPITQILLILQQKTAVPNWVLATFLLFFVSWTVNFTYKKRQKVMRRKQSILNLDLDVSNGFLVGKWINRWTNGGRIGTEEVEIQKDMKYYKDGNYCFNIIDFEYNKKSNKIFFVKSSIRSMDFGKRFQNSLYVINNNLIGGIEDGYDIKYKRIYTPKMIDFSFMVGYWKNQWTDLVGTDFEVCQINANKEYWTRGELFFKIQDFKYDSSTHMITFFKVPDKKDDPRMKTFVKLTIKDNDTLVGKEDESDILFTREF